MKEVVSCERMKQLDAYTIEKRGIPSCVLMERAALKTVEEMEKVFHKKNTEEKILCVCVSGNNGGDGIAIARILFLHGYQAEIYVAGNHSSFTHETSRQLSIASNYHVPVVNNPQWREYTTIVDAVFGVGLARPVMGKYKELIETMNRMTAWKVAVDIPSGVNGDTGAVMGAAFEADLTVTFGFLKAGLCLYPGRKNAGRTVLADIGVYGESGVFEKKRILEVEDTKKIPGRTPEGNKSTFGKVLAVAGSPGMCGAAYFCAAAAFAGGAGMVRILTDESNRIPLQSLLPEAIIDCGKGEAAYQNAFDWCDVILMGPGLGISEKTRFKVHWFLEKALSGKKVVLDADGLNLLAENPSWKNLLGSHVILTPHMGEMSRLTGKSIGELQDSREASALEYARASGSVCVLKDACTVTTGSDGTVWYNLSGNAGMATAGSGDVLAGVLAGMLCMYRGEALSVGEMTEIAALGVFIHGRAGDLAAENKGMYGMKAGDLLLTIPEVLKYGGRHEEI